MSYKYTAQAKQVRGLSKAAKLLLWELCDISKDSEDPRLEDEAYIGKSWLTRDQLAIRMESTPPTVIKASKELETNRLVKIDKESGESNRYQYYIQEDILRIRADKGRAEREELDIIAKQAARQKMRDYRAHKAAQKTREEFILHRQKYEEENEPRFKIV